MDHTTGAGENSCNEDLVRECFSGNTEAVHALLKNGVSANSEFDGWLPLAAASLVGHNDIVKILLEHDAQVNLKCSNGAVALVEACMNKNAEFVEKELNGRTKWESVFAGIIKINPTQQMETINILINRGANINMQDDDGYSALMVASYAGNMEAVQVLLEHKAQVNMQDNAGDFALLGACMKGHIETVKLLLQEDDVKVDMQEKKGFSALMGASMLGHIEIVNSLLGHGAQVDLQDTDGDAALLLAKNTETAKVIIDHGANVNISNIEGYSALMYASMMANADMAKLLIEKGAQLNMKNKDGNS